MGLGAEVATLMGNRFSGDTLREPRDSDEVRTGDARDSIESLWSARIFRGERVAPESTRECLLFLEGDAFSFSSRVVSLTVVMNGEDPCEASETSVWPDTARTSYKSSRRVVGGVWMLRVDCVVGDRGEAIMEHVE